MRDAETTLNIIRERGRRGQSINDLYRKLYNPEFYLHAYARLYKNDGAMTPGSTEETVDAMSLNKIHQLIDDLRHERYRWSPARRAYIPKMNGKKRPLGVMTWKDKLLQDVIRMLLEAFYEPQFSIHSHGFRPEQGCHTALREIQQKWTGTVWFIEGDISQCFERIDHQVLLSILSRKIHDKRFLRLLSHLLQAGYLEEWQYHKTLSGTPQRGLVLEQSQLIKELRLLQEHLEQLEEEIKTIVEHAREGQILLSMGIGPIQAATIIAAIGSIENFPNAGKLKAYCGWAPVQKQTGTTLDHVHLAPGGTRLMRHTMFLIVTGLIRQETEWAKLYERLVEAKCPYDERRGKRTGKIRVMGRIAGQVIEMIYALLKTDAEVLTKVTPGQEPPPPTLYDPHLHRRHREGQYRPVKASSRPNILTLLPKQQE